MTKDYYKILEISEFSTAEEIKNAYRNLARKWHPDIAGNTPSVIARFKEINEAYEILSDKTRKTDYDTAKKFYSYAKDNHYNKKQKKADNYETKAQNKYQKENNKCFNWENIFKTNQKKAPNQPQKGNDIYSDIEISAFEAISGTTKTINILQTSVCNKCNGRKFANGTKCSACDGKGESSVYKRFNVKIPCGIKNKSKIRLAGEGEKGIFGGTNGDLYLIINIRETKNYKTEGLNILKTVQIAPFEAALGCELEIATIKGKVSVKIASGTKNGQKIRLTGCGIEQNNQVGDMIVSIEIQIPKDLTEEELYLYKKLKSISGNDIRSRLE